MLMCPVPLHSADTSQTLDLGHTAALCTPPNIRATFISVFREFPDLMGVFGPAVYCHQF